MEPVTHNEEALFDVARRMCDAARRRTYLDRACAGDAALRARLDGLLAAADEADGFFAEGRSAPGFPRTAEDLMRETGTVAGAVGEEPVGTRIGRYKLVQKIGEGGCGVVYLAEQEEPVQRRVALKIIKLGMETQSVIARFEAERQALALMDHPHIARVFDAGATERGRPYFVMELVRGTKITEYCDARRLDVAQRLELFIQICHAIQHAHQKGIIHGDIKPSNVLVTELDGVAAPKVIDFGISKATEARLTDKLLFTAYAQLVGTPAYMSPEQAQLGGVDIDTRSDIYSLGVLLYELLAGRTPFDAKALLAHGLDEMRRTLREREPARPAARLAGLAGAELTATAAGRATDPARLIAAVRGDLDWIAMKALEKDRGRRYETANGLAMDVHRHMHNEPVVARPPSWLYRLQKLVRRNRVVFGAGAAVVLALTAGFGTSTWLFLKEREARQRAVLAEQQQARLRLEAEVRARITQAALLVSQERFEEADGLLREIAVTQPTMEGAAVFRAVGEWHALENRWRQAADRLSLLLRVNQLESADMATMDELRCGPALIELGDGAAYERFRTEAVARFAGAPSPFADRIVKISLLRAAERPLLEALTPIIEANLQSMTAADAAGDGFTAAWRALAVSLFEYRKGRYTEAESWARRCLSYRESNGPRNATARLLQGMAARQQGRLAVWAREVAAVRGLLEERGPGETDRGNPVQGFWFDWAFARILLREAEAMQGRAGEE